MFNQGSKVYHPARMLFLWGNLRFRVYMCAIQLSPLCEDFDGYCYYCAENSATKLSTHCKNWYIICLRGGTNLTEKILISALDRCSGPGMNQPRENKWAITRHKEGTHSQMQLFLRLGCLLKNVIWKLQQDAWKCESSYSYFFVLLTTEVLQRITPKDKDELT